MGAAEGQVLTGDYVTILTCRGLHPLPSIQHSQEPLVLLSKECALPWDVGFLIRKTNFINNKISLFFFGPYRLQSLEIDAGFSWAAFWNIKNKSLPAFSGDASCSLAMRTYKMLAYSIKESGKFEFVLGIFSFQLQNYLFFFSFLMQRYFTYTNASSILFWPLEQFIECKLSRKICLSRINMLSQKMLHKSTKKGSRHLITSSLPCKRKMWA